MVLSDAPAEPRTMEREATTAASAKEQVEIIVITLS
jgi:hypothetical protein